MKKLLISAFVLAGFFACKPQENKEKAEQKDTTQKSVSTTSAKEEKKEEPKNEVQSSSLNLDLTGSYYCLESKEMLLIERKDEKIKKLMFAGSGAKNFVEAQLLSESKEDFYYKFSFKVGGKTMEAMLGVSPRSHGFSITENGNTAVDKYFMHASSGSAFSMESAKYGVPFFVREIYWRGFKNEANGATLIAEDSQEGTAEGQLNMGYKDASGKEEFFAAQVNPTTHELTFDSKMLGGKIRCKFVSDMGWTIEMFKGNQKIGEFKEIIEEPK